MRSTGRHQFIGARYVTCAGAEAIEAIFTFEIPFPPNGFERSPLATATETR
jgi:hypothetical protein